MDKDIDLIMDEDIDFFKKELHGISDGTVLLITKRRFEHSIAFSQACIESGLKSFILHPVRLDDKACVSTRVFSRILIEDGEGIEISQEQKELLVTRLRGDSNDTDIKW